MCVCVCVCGCFFIKMFVIYRQLLLDCGIGTEEEEEEEEEGVESVVNQHRVLLFCQYKSMLDIIESDLLK